MQTVTLGRTGLKVGVAGLGTGGRSRVGMAGGTGEDGSVDLVRAALDRGVTLIDTASVYGTEAIVGRAIAGRRDGVVVSTKARVNRPGTLADGMDLVTAAELRASVEASLRHLRTDVVDILHLHGVRPQQYDYCVATLLPELGRLREAGKIRFLGITETFGVDLDHETLSRAIGDGFWDVVMPGYSYLNTSGGARVLPAAIRGRVGTLCMYAVRGPLADASSLRPIVERLVAKGEVDRAVLDLPDLAAFLLEGSGARSLAELGYRFCRHTPGLDVVLFGTGRLDHLEANIAAINGPPLAEEAVARLLRVFGRVRSEAGDPPQ